MERSSKLESEPMTNLYDVQKKDILRAAAVLADAFQKDPFWIRLFEGEDRSDNRNIVGSFYESIVRYGCFYGTVLATSGGSSIIIRYRDCAFGPSVLPTKSSICSK